MIKNYQLILIKYLNKKSKNLDSAFTLVELIVVIVIIGILSSIAIPAFTDASDKARQKEATTLIATYIKAAQAYQTESGAPAQNSTQIKEFVQLTGCAQATKSACDSLVPTEVANDRITWNSPAGTFQIQMGFASNKTTFTATSTAVPAGRGVGGCYNNLTGSSRVLELKTKGDVTAPDC